MDYVLARLLESPPALALTCPTASCSLDCASCWHDLAELAVWVNQNRSDLWGRPVGCRRVRQYFQMHVENWNRLRTRMRPLVMTPTFFGQLFDAPVARCRCRLAAAEECSVRDCAGCYQAMRVLVEWAAAHLVDGRGSRFTVDALHERIWSRPDEWDVLRVGLLPVGEAVEAVADCTVCLTPMVRARWLTCGHAFHAGCVRQWLRRVRNCPVCRARQP
jgi:hypothetical protein